MGKRFFGVSLILTASFFWAAQITVTKAALGYAGVLQVLSIGFATAAFLLFIFLKAAHKPLKLSGSALSSLVKLALLAGFAELLFAYGLGRTAAINAGILAHIQPLFVSIFAYYILGERLKKNVFSSGILMLAGALLVSAGSLTQLTSLRLAHAGDIFIIAAAVFWAGALVTVKKALQEVEPCVAAFYRFLLLFLLVFPLLLYFSTPIFHPIMLLLGAIFAVGYVLYYTGLRELQSNEATLIELATPVFTAILAVFLLGEPLTWIQIMGGALVGIGVYIISATK